jgi:hypothetical protein
MPLTATGYVAIKSPEEQDAAAQAQQQAMSDAASARLGHNGDPSMDDEQDESATAGNPKKNKPKPKDDAEKLTEADLKKKRINPYLPTTAHRHKNRERL